MCDESAECPLCMEALEIDDQSFFPCTCGYQICRFCWHRIRTDENGLCPACRKHYPEDPAEFKPLTEDELQNIKKERKQKDVQRKQKAAENRKHLANVRVVQRNLVFVVGLSPRLADPEVLKKQEYFGKFGKIHKVVINQSTSYAGSQGPSASAYVTYVKPEDALRAILTVNNVHVDGRTLKTSLGTTKYCSHFLKGSHCQKNDCMYLHELGEEAASFTKDEMQAGKHQEYEQNLIEQFLNAQNAANNHVIAHTKLKKSVSPIENTDVIPSLMDMTGDIKHTLPPSGPLLPDPVGAGCVRESLQTSQTSGWPLLDPPSTSPSPGNGVKTENGIISNNRVQSNHSKGHHRTLTPPESGGNNSSRAPGAGRQRGSNGIVLNGTDENHIPSINNHSPPIDSNGLSVSPTVDREELSPHTNGPLPHSGLPLPNPVNGSNGQQPPAPMSSPRTASGAPGLSTPPASISPALISSNSSINIQGQNPRLQQHNHQNDNGSGGIVGAIGSNRRAGSSETNGAHGLSFFGNNLLQPGPIRTQTAPSPTATSQEMPNVSLPNTDMEDSLPVSSSTDWSAAFGFRSKDLTPDIDNDDLGFDPCAESFKGLADLIEKENGMQQFSQSLPVPPQGHQQRLASSPTHNSSGFPSHPVTPGPGPIAPGPITAPPAPPAAHQNNTQQQPPVRNLPPGFSISHIQQQQQQLQQQHFFRPEMGSSKMLELLPQFAPAVTQNRFPPLHSYPSMPLDLHAQQQHQQRENGVYNMTDMQEQLRSMLPNINISFGSAPHQQQHHQSQQQQQQQQQIPNSMHHTHQSQNLNKSWPLSSSPDSPWNDPAIVTTSKFSDNNTSTGLFQESAPHWLKSLQQLTECDGPSTHRLPFVQQFPLAGAGGWPPHTHNPPPGFRAPGLPSQQNTDSHQQMAEVLQ